VEGAASKTLRFKPWSGREHLNEGEGLNVIEEEIEALWEREDEEHGEAEVVAPTDNFS
jgi:hypothetical protein